MVSPRSGRQHKAWGASPRIKIKETDWARETGDSQNHHPLSAASRAHHVCRL